MKDEPENPETMAASQQRLRDLFDAYAEMRRQTESISKAEFARRIGMTPQAWNEVTRASRIGIDQALMVCRFTGVTLDWIYRGGSVALLPQELGAHIRQIETRRRNPTSSRSKKA
jgi:transcriptional regulator with XRE-family HTH domain